MLLQHRHKQKIFNVVCYNEASLLIDIKGLISSTLWPHNYYFFSLNLLLYEKKESWRNMKIVLSKLHKICTVLTFLHYVQQWLVLDKIGKCVNCNAIHRITASILQNLLNVLINGSNEMQISELSHVRFKQNPWMAVWETW
jgi:hypothetical protein